MATRERKLIPRNNTVKQVQNIIAHLFRGMMADVTVNMLQLNDGLLPETVDFEVNTGFVATFAALLVCNNNYTNDNQL